MLIQIREVLSLYIDARLPTDLLKDFSKAHSLRGVDRFHKSYAPLKVGSEIMMSRAVLALRSASDAIRKDCLQAVELCANHIETLVGNETGEVLPHTLAHNAGLVVVDAETLFDENFRRVRFESLNAPRENFIAGKRKIVSIACVLCAR